MEIFQGLLTWLNDGKAARGYDCDDDTKTVIATSDLLTLKPVIYAANLDEAGFADPEGTAYYQQVAQRAQAEAPRSSPYAPSWRRRSPSWRARRRPCSWRTWAWLRAGWTGW